MALAAFAAVALAIGGGAAAQPAAQLAPTSPEAMLERLVEAPLPGRNPTEVAIRLRGAPPTLRVQVPPPAPPRTVGASEEFWVVDLAATQTFRARATLRLATPHTYWYVQDDYVGRVSQADMERSAAFFEERTYPTIRAAFGPEPEPGVDGDPRLVFFLGNVPGVAAYFSGVDAFPRAVNPRSNERDMIYVNLEALRPGTSGFDSTLAHEFQHMTHFARCPLQETWVEEGSSELATRVLGFGGGRQAQFAARPDVQLTDWSAQPGQSSRYYQAAYLFLRYTVDQFGGFSAVPDLFAGCQRGTDLVARFLERRGSPRDFEALFADWTVANLVNDRRVDDGRFGYADDDVQVRPRASVGAGETLSGEPPQYSAQYVEVRPGVAAVDFQGAGTVPLLPLEPRSGRAVWWSNRADSLDSTLTRALDLRDVARATLRFKAWYDVEDRYDFVYVAVSQDGGSTWRPLAGRTTQRDDHIGNDFGVGWTGRSGANPASAEWVDEEVDLTPYAGSEVLLRFEYLTDQGYNARGFALDDIEVPEIGYLDPAEDDDGWLADGWVRVDAALPQRWLLRRVQWTGETVSVAEIPLGPDGRSASVAIPPADRTVLVIAPTAFRTVEPARFALTAR